MLECVLHMRVWVRPNWALRLLCVHLHLTVGKCFHSPLCLCHVHMCQPHPALQILSQYKVKYLHVFFFPDVLCTKREESLLYTVPSFFHFRCFPTTIPHSLLIKCLDKSGWPTLSCESKQAMKTTKPAKIKQYLLTGHMQLLILEWSGFICVGSFNVTTCIALTDQI